MSKIAPKNHKNLVRSVKKQQSVGIWQQLWGKFTAWTVRRHFWKRLFLGLMALLILAFGSMYGIAQWYIHSNSNQPLVMGATFVPDYARYFGLDPKTTFWAITHDLGVKQVRLASYWDNIEPTQGNYNFDELDWQFKMAQDAGVKVSLAIGLRQPRWPECHEPAWARKLQDNAWEDPLYNFMAIVVNRYKNSSALDSYQLENEFFLKAFGECTNFDRSRLVHEYNMVKALDPNHTLVVSMSNNAIGTPIGDPTPDEWSISVYKRVWDKTITKRYFEYPIPAWYYAFRAGFTKITRGHDSFIHELQAEPWTPDTYGGITTTPLAEQDKSMNAEILSNRIQYGQATGMKTIYLWGVEWWYWRMTTKNDASLWNAGKTSLQKISNHNLEILKNK
jgi:hypothetical protein